MCKVKCKICGLEFTDTAIGYHLSKTHKVVTEDYINQFYEFPKSVVNWKTLSVMDAEFIKMQMSFYPKFKNCVDLFQYLYDEDSDLRRLNKKYNYNMMKLCICLGVKTNRNLSQEHKDKIAKARTGQKLSEEHKQKISLGVNNVSEEVKKDRYSRAAKSRTGHRHSKESIIKMIKNRSNPNKPFRGKLGIREDLGHFVRSTWEANFARILRLLGWQYEYEPEIFWVNREDGSEISYTPDFKVGNTYIEIKGYWFGDAKEKFDLFRQQYPNIKVRVIDKYKYLLYQNKFKDRINEWE